MGDVNRYRPCQRGYPLFADMVAQPDGHYTLHSDYAALLTRHNALVEAVAWFREVDDVREWLAEFPWMRRWSGLDQCMNEARAEVDRLITMEASR